MFNIGLVIINVSISTCLSSHYNQPLCAQVGSLDHGISKGNVRGSFPLPHFWQFVSCYNSAKEHRGFPSQVPSWFWLLFISSPCLNSRSKIEEVSVLNPRSACNEPWFQLQEQLLLYKSGEFTYSSGGHRTNLRTRPPLFVSLFFYIYFLKHFDIWVATECGLLTRLNKEKNPIK